MKNKIVKNKPKLYNEKKIWNTLSLAKLPLSYYLSQVINICNKKD